ALRVSTKDRSPHSQALDGPVSASAANPGSTSGHQGNELEGQMRKFLLTVSALGLLLSSASAQVSLTDTELWRRDGLVKKDVPRFVPNGKSRMVGFFTGANADCSAWDLKAMDVQTTKAPEHRTVEIVSGESFMTFAKDGVAAHCSGKKYRGTAVNYKSSAGFTGLDEFEVLVMSPHGWATEVHFKMNVR